MNKKQYHHSFISQVIEEPSSTTIRGPQGEYEMLGPPSDKRLLSICWTMQKSLPIRPKSQTCWNICVIQCRNFKKCEPRAVPAFLMCLVSLQVNWLFFIQHLTFSDFANWHMTSAELHRVHKRNQSPKIGGERWEETTHVFLSDYFGCFARLWL